MWESRDIWIEINCKARHRGLPKKHSSSIIFLQLKHLRPPPPSIRLSQNKKRTFIPPPLYKALLYQKILQRDQNVVSDCGPGPQSQYHKRKLKKYLYRHVPWRGFMKWDIQRCRKGKNFIWMLLTSHNKQNPHQNPRHGTPIILKAKNTNPLREILQPVGEIQFALEPRSHNSHYQNSVKNHAWTDLRALRYNGILTTIE